MDTALLVHRSLGVPDLLQPANVRTAAAAAVLRRSGLDVAKIAPGNERDAREALERDAGHVLDTIIDMLDTGVLDPLLGNYGERDKQFFEDKLTGKAKDRTEHDQFTADLARAALDAVVAYVAEHPHDEA